MALFAANMWTKRTSGSLYLGMYRYLLFAHLEFCLHMGRIAIIALLVTRVSLCERSQSSTSYDPFNGDHITPTNDAGSAIVCVCLNKGSVDTCGCDGGYGVGVYILSILSRQGKWRRLVNHSWLVWRKLREIQYLKVSVFRTQSQRCLTTYTFRVSEYMKPFSYIDRIGV